MPVRLAEGPDLPKRGVTVRGTVVVGVALDGHAGMDVALVHEILLLDADDDAGVDEAPPIPIK
ncbi:hypothetical protein D3C83_186040 [compost metagenome]